MEYPAALKLFRDRSDYDRGFVSNPFAGDAAAISGLQRARLLLEELDSPDRAYPIIHVAGTKGKGSTCAFIESVARSSGLNTGLFVTPHLHTVRERIQIMGSAISEQIWSNAVADAIDATRVVETRHPELGRITAFELNTAMALLVFAETRVDIGIVEVGLGGRLDATNVINPSVAVITPISYDHQAILGESLEEIATEKAGIIKAKVPVVVSNQESGALDVIESRAATAGSPFYPYGSSWTICHGDENSSLHGPWGEITADSLGLRGAHQATNAGAALMSLWLLKPDLFQNHFRVLTGLRETRWPGRFEVVSTEPDVVVDGAHNGASIRILVAALQATYSSATGIVVFGSYRDKDLEEMLDSLRPVATTVVATRSTSPRSRSPEEIAKAASDMGFDAESTDSVPEALNRALSRTNHDGLIIGTGSLSVVAEIREYFGHAPDVELERQILGS